MYLVDDWTRAPFMGTSRISCVLLVCMQWHVSIVNKIAQKRRKESECARPQTSRCVVQRIKRHSCHFIHLGLMRAGRRNGISLYWLRSVCAFWRCGGSSLSNWIFTQIFLNMSLGDENQISFPWNSQFSLSSTQDSNPEIFQRREGTHSKCRWAFSTDEFTIAS